jgi:hypothetical protein
LTGQTPEPIDDAFPGTDDHHPLDLGTLRRTDELFAALSERRAVRSDDVVCPDDADVETGDPAVALLRALVHDVDDGAPPLCPRPQESRVKRSPHRLPHTLVSLCVATTVLMTTGVAAAGGAITPFAQGNDRSEQHLWSRPDLPTARRAEARAGNEAAPRFVPPQWFPRHETIPRSGKAAETDDGSHGPRPTTPTLMPSPTVTPTPTPLPGPYGVYAGPAGAPLQTPAPDPSSELGAEPDTAPSGPLGQGLQQLGSAGQDPVPGQGTTP